MTDSKFAKDAAVLVDVSCRADQAFVQEAVDATREVLESMRLQPTGKPTFVDVEIGEPLRFTSQACFDTADQEEGQGVVDQLSSDVTEAILLAEQEASQEAYQRVFELESRLADLTHASTAEGIAARLGTVSAAREAGKPVMALVNAKWFLLDPELPPCARQSLETACKELLVELAP